MKKENWYFMQMLSFILHYPAPNPTFLSEYKRIFIQYIGLENWMEHVGLGYYYNPGYSI